MPTNQERLPLLHKIVRISQERLSFLQKIVRISQDFISATSTADLLHQIVAAAAELTGSEDAVILLADEDNQALRVVAAASHADQIFDFPVPMDQSFAGAVFKSGKASIVSDVRRNPHYYSFPGQIIGLAKQSLITVPLFFKEDKLGVLAVQNKTGGQEYGQNDIESLTALAALAAIAIHNANTRDGLSQANDQAKQRNKQYEQLLNSELEERKLAQALGQASASLTSTLNLQEVVDRILYQIEKVILCDAAFIMLIEENDQARIVWGRGYEKFKTSKIGDATLLNIKEVPGLHKMIENGQPLIISDVTQDATWFFSWQDYTGIRAYLGVPISSRASVIGFLNVLSTTPGAFTQKDAQHLQEFSNHVAIAITNARLHQQAQKELADRIRIEAELREHRDHLEELVIERTAELTRSLADAQNLNQQLQLEIQARQQAEENLRVLAITDPLTGAYNRRQLWVLGEQAMKHALRYHRDMAAIMIDVDHFKHINDTYGHAVGDEVLKLLVGYLRETLRKADILVRYGGEEFVVLMPETNLETGRLVAERLLAGVRGLAWKTDTGPVTFTVSIGLAVWKPGNGDDIETLINCADASMYIAKQAGRNQLMVSPDLIKL